jgi:hypothetical protein
MSSVQQYQNFGLPVNIHRDIEKRESRFHTVCSDLHQNHPEKSWSGPRTNLNSMANISINSIILIFLESSFHTPSLDPEIKAFRPILKNMKNLPPE